MKPEYDSRGVGGAQFHTTRWTLVMASAELISMDWESAETRLGEFCPVCMLRTALHETLEFSGEELPVAVGIQRTMRKTLPKGFSCISWSTEP